MQLEELLILQAARPFDPFILHMTSGAEIPVPTVDHVSILRHARRVFVDTDDGKTYHIIVPDQISHVTAASRAA